MMGGAAQYLQELPSRGFFSASQVSSPSPPGGLRTYVCDHETAPPEEQLIKTDSSNILIRYLTLKKKKVDPKVKDNKRKAPTEEGKGSRFYSIRLFRDGLNGDSESKPSLSDQEVAVCPPLFED